MRWKEHNAHLAMAEEIQQGRPQWLVVWGTYTGFYWAFALFDMSTRVIPYSADPEKLVELMDRAEERFRIWGEGRQ